MNLSVRQTHLLSSTQNLKIRSRLSGDGKDPRYAVVDEWFQDEICRVNRLMELKKEEWWIKALSSVDREGQSALHYLAANEAINAAELLHEMTRTGRGNIRPDSRLRTKKGVTVILSIYSYLCLFVCVCVCV